MQGRQNPKSMQQGWEANVGPKIKQTEDDHLDTCTPEFYKECNWNGDRIIVIVQQTKK